jgi:Rad17 P-loop domain
VKLLSDTPKKPKTGLQTFAVQSEGAAVHLDGSLHGALRGHPRWLGCSVSVSSFSKHLLLERIRTRCCTSRHAGYIRSQLFCVGSDVRSFELSQYSGLSVSTQERACAYRAPPSKDITLLVTLWDCSRDAMTVWASTSAGAGPSTSSHGSRDPKNQPWIEKYRPKTLDEVAANKEIIETIKRLTDENRLPHLLLYGPPGVAPSAHVSACKLMVVRGVRENLHAMISMLFAHIALPSAKFAFSCGNAASGAASACSAVSRCAVITARVQGLVRRPPCLQ